LSPCATTISRFELGVHVLKSHRTPAPAPAPQIFVDFVKDTTVR
jgi:hypothetical protein